MRTPFVWLIWGAVTVAALAGIVTLIVMFGGQGTRQAATSDVWTCSMHPQVRMPKAGRCPICGMDLIPLSQLAASRARIEQLAGLVTQSVEFRQLVKELRTVGKLEFNERRMATIASRVSGRVDRVFADFTGIEVKPKDHLVSIYSPALYVAQSELFRALERREELPSNRRFEESLVQSSRAKLELLGILPEQIAEMEKTRKELTHLTIYAPIGGTVIEKNIRQGQYVQEGDVLYRIADLDPLWLYLDVYEYDLAWIRYGQSVEVRVEAYPSEAFRGTVVFIDPFLDDKTRTVRVRVNMSNAQRLLKPAMYASATIRVPLQSDGTPQPTGLEGKFICPMHPEVVADEAGLCTVCQMPLEQVPPARKQPKVANAAAAPTVASGKQKGVLAIPTSAILDTGRRKVAYRKTSKGAYELVEPTLGPRAEAEENGKLVGSFYPVLSGLDPGDEVVIRGAFLLDSQQQIEGMPSLLYARGQGPVDVHAGHGMSSPAKKPAASGHQH